MKYMCSAIFLLLSIFAFNSNSEGKTEFPVLQGPYFGQPLPGLIPEVFASGIVSIDGRSEYGVSFSSDLGEMYFTVQKEYGVPACIYFSQLKNSQWTPFTTMNFTKGKKAGEMEPFVSLDGKKIYFTAYNADFTDTKIWYVSREQNGWSNAFKLDSPINDEEVFNATLANNGDLFYTDIYQSKTYYAPLKNGQYPEVQQVDIEFGVHGFISPSQDYLLVDARNIADEQRKDSDLYAYFKNKDGTWTKPINLGIEVNSAFDETVTSITPDGKYLFFSRRNNEQQLDVFWVSTAVIETLRPKA